MENIENKLAACPKYVELLGKAQAIKILQLFSGIEAGKYDKEEFYVFQLKTLKHPLHLRSIRADMQSFINTFIEPYFEKKPYQTDTKTVIDAGANIGYTAVLFANWWPGSKILSIEPDEENYEFTVKNTAHYPNITVIHGALWNKKIKLKIEAGQEDGFVVKEIANEDNVKPENLALGISIEYLMQKYNFQQIDFLKLNIEGSEKEVFSENYQSWLPKTKVVLVELHDGKNPGSSKSVFSAMNNYAFAVAETAPYGIVFAWENIYRPWYAKWYKQEIYLPNINKERFPKFYLDGNS